jgi:hypothetical protein
LGQFSKNYRTFYSKIVTKLLGMGLGSGIRDPGSGINLFRIPDPGVKKAPDPGSATRGSRMGKNPDPGSAITNPEHFYKSLLTKQVKTI